MLFPNIKKYCRWLAVAGIISIAPFTARAQHFINNGGGLTNNGTFKVKDTFEGFSAADTINGTFEYFGGTQTVRAALYKNLKVLGSGTKTSAGGNFSVTENLEIASTNIFAIQPSSTIILGGTLTENGYLKGSIIRRDTLSNTTSQLLFGNIGVQLQTGGSVNAVITARRISDSTASANQHSSIRRVVVLSSNNDTTLNGVLSLRYNNQEITSHSAASLALWRFNTTDAQWRRQKSIVDTSAKTISLQGKIPLGIWTASDENNLLGSSKYEWMPDAVERYKNSIQLAKIRRKAKPIVARVVDGFNQPVEHAVVAFTLQTPLGVTGASLVKDTVITNAQGEAQTSLILGDKLGVYKIQARVLQLTPQEFIATAADVKGDANDDFNLNIADITSIISHIRGTIKIDSANLDFADFNNDGKIDIADIDSVRVRILNGMEIDTLGFSAFTKTPLQEILPQQFFAADSTVAYFNTEITSAGLRCNMKNTKPIAGIQLYMKFTNQLPLNAERTDVVYSRGQQMDIRMKISENRKELRLVGYNLNNIPIRMDSGSVFRLPITLTSAAQIESIFVVLSTDSSKIVYPYIEKTMAQPGKYPSTFALHQNYPNPFNGMTKIEYDVPDVAGKLKITYLFVYDILGRKVKTLAAGEHEAKRHVAFWDGSDDSGGKVASGVYFYQLIGKDFVSSKKMVYVQ